MERKCSFLLLLLLAAASAPEPAEVAPAIHSVRLVHRFSVEGQTLLGSDGGSGETTTMMFEHDLKRLGAQLVPGLTFDYGNDMAWLHYTWLDVGMQNKSFLVALDTGSDLFWLPCDCVACASLSPTLYSTLGKELIEYSPSRSNTSRAIPCGHELCKNDSFCESPKGHCPYLAKYQSEDTSSSGFLFEDVLSLATIGEDKQQSSIYASVVIGCGSKQTGSLLLEGTAPNGVIGLGPGDISVPSMLAKSGIIPHSYSFCYDDTLFGRLYFGDQGPTSQRSTQFLPLKDYRNIYVVEVDRCCVGSSCPNQTGFQAQVDTGTSFTYLPRQIHEQVISEFQRRSNATSVRKGIFENCFNASSLNISSIPSLKLVFPKNQSFQVENLVFPVIDMGTFYCLGMHPIDGDIGFIGQNFMMGYRMVFDGEKLKLGWSISNCHDIGPKPAAPSQQQGGAQGHIAPARITSSFLFFCTAYVIYYMI